MDVTAAVRIPGDEDSGPPNRPLQNSDKMAQVVSRVSNLKVHEETTERDFLPSISRVSQSRTQCLDGIAKTGHFHPSLGDYISDAALRIHEDRSIIASTDPSPASNIGLPTQMLGSISASMVEDLATESPPVSEAFQSGSYFGTASQLPRTTSDSSRSRNHTRTGWSSHAKSRRRRPMDGHFEEAGSSSSHLQSMWLPPEEAVAGISETSTSPLTVDPTNPRAVHSQRVAQEAAEMEAKYQSVFLAPEWNEDSIQPLEWMLTDIYGALQPTEEDYLRRMHVIQRLSNLFQSLDGCKGADVVPFGSFESNFYTPWGDLDLSLELPVLEEQAPAIPKSRKVKILRSIERALLKSGVTRKVQMIGHARVPLLMFVDAQANIACDVSVDNGSALFKSRVLRWITDMDPRCRCLIFLIKCWAKAQSINDPKMGTLNSFTICLLVVFHLQTQEPPILPPFKVILGDSNLMRAAAGRASRESWKQLMDECFERIQAYIAEGYGKDNTSTLTYLFLSFFGQFASVKQLWRKGLAVSTFTGEWREIAWKNKCYPMTVEDPFDRSENCARSVQDFSLPMICDTFVRTAEALLHPPHWTSLECLRVNLFCWLLGHQRPGVHLRQFPPSGSLFWTFKGEQQKPWKSKGEQCNQQQKNQSRTESQMRRGAAFKVKELHASSSLLLDSTSELVSVGGSQLPEELDDNQQPSLSAVAYPESANAGPLPDQVAAILHERAGTDGNEGELLVAQEPVKTNAKFKQKQQGKKKSADQWAKSAEQWVSSHKLQTLTVSNESGTASTPLEELSTEIPFTSTLLKVDELQQEATELSESGTLGEGGHPSNSAGGLPLESKPSELQRPFRQTQAEQWRSESSQTQRGESGQLKKLNNQAATAGYSMQVYNQLGGEMNREGYEQRKDAAKAKPRWKPRRNKRMDSDGVERNVPRPRDGERNHRAGDLAGRQSSTSTPGNNQIAQSGHG